MSRVIGEGVQDYEIVLAAIKDKICFIIVFPRFLAQDTAAFRGSLYVFYSPWRPEIFHKHI